MLAGTGRLVDNERMPDRDRDLHDEHCACTLAHGHPSFIHQHVVDAFAAQCADETTKPIAFALVGLYLHVERGSTGRDVQRVHMKLARANARRQWPEFNQPESRGAVTVADVMSAPPGPERDQAIDGWCASVWDAWQASRERVVEWLQSELG